MSDEVIVVESYAPRVRVGDIWFDNVNMAEAVARIDELAALDRAAYVVTPNVDHVVRAHRDPDYARLVAGADLVLADGQPVVWSARLCGTPLKERVAGSDLFPRLCAHAASVGWRVFFFGGAPGVAEEARRVLESRHPGLQVVGTYCPPMGFEKDPVENQRALEVIAAARPQILFVGLGSPKQERWIVAHQDAYGPAVSLGIGISFSFVAGHVRRAPRPLQRLGLEWLHRVIMEPRRLAKRYFVDGWKYLPIFLSDVRGGLMRVRS
jgi:N-acetylglucosaminyldiphosphoundecaprenol N-acetyl-beta-D-mannosaminyltransferase